MDPTRASLLVRIRDRGDEEAWRQFLELYSPFLLRYARRLGIAADDANDVVQEVLRIVLQRIRGFEYDPARGRFRNWLYTVATHEARRSMRVLARQPRAVGGTTAQHAAAAVPGSGDELAAMWDQEWRHHLLERAMEEVRPTVKPRTWEAFVMLAVYGRPAEEVARDFHTSVGSLYVIKSRLLHKLQRKVNELDD